MASGALVELELEGVWVVALMARGVTLHMGEEGVVGLAVVLIAALGLGAVLRCGGGVVVDVEEAEILAHLVIVGTGLLDGGVHADGRVPPLVAVHAPGLASEAGEDQPGRHLHRVEGQSDVVVARHARNRGPRIDVGFDRAEGAAVDTEEVEVACLTVASGTRRRYHRRVVLVPVAECLGVDVVVARPRPSFEEGDCDLGGRDRGRLGSGGLGSRLGLLRGGRFGRGCSVGCPIFARRQHQRERDQNCPE